MATFPLSNLSLRSLGIANGDTAPYNLGNLTGSANFTNLNGAISLPSSGSLSFNTFRGASTAMRINFPNMTTSLTNWTLPITVPYLTIYNTDFQDIRFIDQTSQTSVDYWIESVSGSSAKVWLKIPSLSSNTNIRIHNKYSASTGSTSILPFYHNFPGSSLDTDVWNEFGSLSVSNNQLTLTNTFCYISTKKTQSELGLGLDVIVEADILSESASAIPEIVIRGDTSNNYGIKGRMDCRGGVSKGLGGILNNPFSRWSMISEPTETPLPINTLHTFRFEGIGNTFQCFLNGTQEGSAYSNTEAHFNSDGIIALCNHAGAPLQIYNVKAYKGTAQNIVPSFS